VVEENSHDVTTPTESADAGIENSHKTKEKYGIFCPGPECPHYSQATKYPRKCFYEPQCWRGRLDLVLWLFALRLNMSQIREHH